VAENLVSGYSCITNKQKTSHLQCTPRAKADSCNRRHWSV